MEDDFLRLIGLCLDPDDPASRSIVEKALRSLTPSSAKSARDARVRATLRRRVLEKAMEGDEIPKTGIYPGLGEKWGRPISEQVAVPIPADYFRRLTEKVVRGIAFIEDGKFIEPPYKISFFALDSVAGDNIRAIVDKFGRTYAHEPGIIVRRSVAVEDGISALFEIELWRQFKVYASVTDDAPSHHLPAKD